MEVCNEINGCIDGIAWDDLLNFDCSLESYEDLQSKYAKLHETYIKEVETSKKVKKSLEKCLKFYSKLCEKFEAQQTVINSLEKNIQEKMSCLKESYETQERLQGLIGVYKTERKLYSGESNYCDLKKDKELLLDLCCQLINESVKTNNTRNITNLILRKFKKDLNNEKLELLKGRQNIIKKEFSPLKKSNFSAFGDIRPLSLPNNILLNQINEEQKDNDFEVKEEGLSPQSCDGVDKSEEFSDKTDSLEKHAKELKADISSVNCPLNPNVLYLNEKPTDLNNLLTAQNLEKKEGREEEKADKCENLLNDETDSNRNDSLPFLETCTEVISGQGNSSDFESVLFKRCDKKCNSLAGSKETVNENSHSESNPTFSVPSVCSNVRELNSRVMETGCRNVFNVASTKISPSSNTDSEIVPDDGFRKTNKDEEKRNSCRQNVVPKETVQVQGISKLDFKDCDSLKNKALPSSIGVSVPPNSGHREEQCNKSMGLPEVLNIEGGRSDPLPGETTSVMISFSDRKESESNHSGVCDVQKPSTSIFDLPNESVNTHESTDLNREESLELSFGRKSEEETHLLLKEEELCEIFTEMTTVRLLSPIRDKDVGRKKRLLSPETKTKGDLTVRTCRNSPGPSFPETNRTYSREKAEKTKSLSLSEAVRNKKMKLDEPKKTDEGTNCQGYLDFILSAMSIQNEEIKANVFHESFSLLDKFENPNFHSENEIQTVIRKSSTNVERQEPMGKPPETRSQDNRPFQKEEWGSAEKILKKSLLTFVGATYSNKDETDRSVKDCISVLMSCSDEAIARVVVSIVFENINEEVEVRERPVPSLTKTQNHLIVLLTVLKTQYSGYDNIIMLIRTKINEKLFPDVFLWPDDCVETVTRFYVALCKHKNDVKGFWKFCLRAMEDMKKRYCIVVLCALLTWPDTLYHASSEKNNILAITAVNILLHTPKGNMKQRQEKKLLSLKRLLQDFYGFQVKETIERYADRLIGSFFNDEDGSDRSVILLAKCRELAWTGKHLLTKLLENWKRVIMSEGDESKIDKVLKLLDELVPIFVTVEKLGSGEVIKVISCLSEVLNSQKLKHELELKIIEILMNLKDFSLSRKTVAEWVPKEPITKNLETEIIKVKTEDILREIKLNQEGTSRGQKNRGSAGRGKKKQKNKLKKFKKRQKKNAKKMGDCGV